MLTTTTQQEDNGRKTPAVPLDQRLGYTPAEFAAAINKHPSTVYRLIYAGKLKVCKNFGSLFIPRSEAQTLLSDVEVFNPKHRAKDGATAQPEAAAAPA